MKVELGKNRYVICSASKVLSAQAFLFCRGSVYRRIFALWHERRLPHTAVMICHEVRGSFHGKVKIHLGPPCAKSGAMLEPEMTIKYPLNRQKTRFAQIFLLIRVMWDVAYPHKVTVATLLSLAHTNLGRRYNMHGEIMSQFRASGRILS